MIQAVEFQAIVKNGMNEIPREYRRSLSRRVRVYLDPDVDAFMRQLAGKTGKDVQKIVNEWLRSNIKLVESAQ